MFKFLIFLLLISCIEKKVYIVTHKNNSGLETSLRNPKSKFDTFACLKDTKDSRKIRFSKNKVGQFLLGGDIRFFRNFYDLKLDKELSFIDVGRKEIEKINLGSFESVESGRFVLKKKNRKPIFMKYDEIAIIDFDLFKYVDDPHGHAILEPYLCTHQLFFYKPQINDESLKVFTEDF